MTLLTDKQLMEIPKDELGKLHLKTVAAIQEAKKANHWQKYQLYSDYLFKINQLLEP